MSGNFIQLFIIYLCFHLFPEQSKANLHEICIPHLNPLFYLQEIKLRLIRIYSNITGNLQFFSCYWFSHPFPSKFLSALIKNIQFPKNWFHKMRKTLFDLANWKWGRAFINVFSTCIKFTQIYRFFFSFWAFATPK